MYLRIDPHSGEPIYRQIVEEIAYRVASGQLAEGDRLPSIRNLAGQLAINPRTVVKAYDELSHLGIVVLRQGQGAFVTHTEAAPARQRRRAVEEMVRRLVAEASRLGATREEVLEAVHEQLDHLEVNA